MTGWPEYHVDEYSYLNGLMLIFMALPFAAGIAWFLRRRRRKHGFHPVRRFRPTRPARIAEALTLLLGGGVFVSLMSMSTDLNGLLLVADELRPGFAGVVYFLADGVAVVVLFGAIFAFRGFFGHGFWLVLPVLCLYPIILALPFDIPRRLAPEGARRVAISYTIRTEPEIAGADLFINDVRMGKTPLTITTFKLEERVPFWSDPPEGFVEPGARQEEDRSPEYKAWVQIPGETSIGIPKQYYARARYGERWLERRHRARTMIRKRVSPRWTGYNISPRTLLSNGFLTHFDTTLFVVLPGLYDNIEALLDQARMSDYTVGPGWFDAIESYGPTGWEAVTKALTDEPGMRRIADGWAARRCGFDPDARGEKAWAIFEDLFKDPGGDSLSDSIAAYTVSRLAPHLDPERLADHAVSIFRERKRLPPRLLDAVRQVDEILDKPGYPDPNVIESKVSPLLLCWKKDINTALELGGPAPDRYLLRQDYWKKPEYGAPDWIGTPGHEVNRWFYLLANRDSPEGQAFRLQQIDAVLEMAGNFIDGYFVDGRNLKFLFLDNELGPDCPAMRFRPRYQAWLHNTAALPEGGGTSPKGFEESLRYLTWMEPATPTELYATCIREWPGRARWSDFVIRDMLNRSSRMSARGEGDPINHPSKLPPARWREIIQAIIKELDGNRRFYLDCPNTTLTEEYLENVVISSLRKDLRKLTVEIESTWGFDDEEALQALLDEGDGASEIDPNRIGECLDSLSEWLAERPDIELVAILADAKLPDLRKAVSPVVKQHPTPGNRSLLERLLTDPDEEVRSEAQKVKRELDELAATPSSALALESLKGNT